MIALLQFLDNTLLQGFAYAVGVLGLAISFRVLRFPDLTADGSFLLGATGFTALIAGGRATSMLALMAAFLLGAAAGAFTSILHSAGRVNRLLAGILTSMLAYSFAFRILGTSNQGFEGRETFLSRANHWGVLWGGALHGGMIVVAAGLVAAVAIASYGLLHSDLGLLLRATGNNSSFVDGLGRRPSRYQLIGLAIANGLVAVAGATVASLQRFADVNMGFGVIITLVAALVIGEQVIRAGGIDPAEGLAARILAPVLGAVLYFALYLLVLRASVRGWIPLSIQATDLRAVSAVVVAAAILLRSAWARQDAEEMFQF